jgi:gluconate 2-dehydrogenase gamma chain
MMAGQGPSRRELLQALTLAGVASAFPGFSRWSYGLSESAEHGHSHEASSAQAVTRVYTPQFFTPAQYRTVEVLADLILPETPDNDEKLRPGAKDAGVAEFIDFMVFSDPSLQPKFRDGLMWLDHAATPVVSFVSLGVPEQNALLQRLAYKAKQKDSEKVGQKFFELIRRYTVMGFYTTRVGLEALDFPGLKFYSTSPGCAHIGNPEHVGL